MSAPTAPATVTLVCADCGNAFYVAPADSWKTVCRFCWRREARASERVRELAAENSRLRAELSRARSRGPMGFDKARWRQLVQLAHPDKHRNSKAATDATAWLMAVRVECET